MRLPLNNRSIEIADGLTLLGVFASPTADRLLSEVKGVAAAAPFRRLLTPGGRPLSAEMTSAGDCGWTSDRRGYRYEAADPASGSAWPDLPPAMRDLAVSAAGAAGFPGFAPDTVLINRYSPGARMGLHQDRDEADMTQPIVSVSLGLPATFLWAGLARSGPTRRFRLEHGDVLVWGGPSRLAYHGVAPVADGHHPATGAFRYNLTFRRAL